jgi:filamentous hemagglutinin
MPPSSGWATASTSSAWVREQVAQLTGYRYLGRFQNDETQYAALMNAGATFAKQYGLRPGVALSAAQMAQLTSDIVCWSSRP